MLIKATEIIRNFYRLAFDEKENFLYLYRMYFIHARKTFIHARKTFIHARNLEN